MAKGEYENLDDFSDFDAGDFAPDIRLQEVKHKQKRPSDLPEMPFPIDGIDLLSPPGFVGEVNHWIDSQCRYPRQRLAVAASLVTIGNVCGLHYEDIAGGVTSNMMAFCVSASATGKEAVQQAMTDIHAAAGLSRCLHGSIKSEQEVTRNLVEHQSACYTIDEIGIFLGKVVNAQKKGTAAYLEGVFGILMSAYSKANSRLILGGDGRRELVKIYGAMKAKADDAGDTEASHRAEMMMRMSEEGISRPFLSLIGFTTPSTFRAVMDGPTASQGFIGRAIVVTEKDYNPKMRRNFAPSPIPDHMVARMSALFTGGVFDAMERSSARIEYYGQRIPIPTDSDAQDALDSIGAWFWEYADLMDEKVNEASVAMARRGAELVRKIAFILGIPDGRVSLHHVQWAFAYIHDEMQSKIAEVFANDGAADRPKEAMVARISGYLDTDKGITAHSLAHRMKARKEDVETALRTMADAGMAIETTGKIRSRGQMQTVWTKTK